MRDNFVTKSLLKKFGVVAIVIGIILAVIIIRQYMHSISTINTVTKESIRSCNTSDDCVLCQNKCISESVAPSFCSNPIKDDCGCVNGTCQKV